MTDASPPPFHATVLTTAGSTPLVRLGRSVEDLPATILAKLETTGPTGSAFDRVAQRVLDEGERRRLLPPLGTVIEAGSGDLGLALACAAAVRGYRLLFVTDDSQSKEKIAGAQAYGAEVIVCPAAVRTEDPRSTVSVAQRLSEESPDAYYSCFAQTPHAIEAFEQGLGPELIAALGERLTHVFCGVAAGSAVSGLGRAIHASLPSAKVIAVEPVGSTVFDYWRSGRFKVDGSARFLTEEIGCDPPPERLDLEVLDAVVQVEEREAMRCARQLARLDGILTGGAGGAMVAACRQWHVEHGLTKDDVVVCVLPDHGGRYLSTVFNDRWLQENRLLETPLELTAQAVCRRKQTEAAPRLLAVQPHSLVIEAVEMMRRYGISQIPVIDDGKVLGSVTEGRLVHLLLSDADARSRPIEGVLEPGFPVVEPTATLEEVSALLTPENSAVLVRGDDGLEILTKADLIRAISR